MSVDPMTYRQVVGNFATGIAVVTSGSGDNCQGVTVNSFTSVSLAPTLLLICLDTASRSRATIIDSGVFNINVLRADQEHVSRLFASKDRTATWYYDLHCEIGNLGAPMIPGCLAFMECQLSESHEVGDHTILIAEVQHARVAGEGEPLLFFRGKYAQMAI